MGQSRFFLESSLQRHVQSEIDGVDQVVLRVGEQDLHALRIVEARSLLVNFPRHWIFYNCSVGSRFRGHATRRRRADRADSQVAGKQLGCGVKTWFFHLLSGIPTK